MEHLTPAQSAAIVEAAGLALFVVLVSAFWSVARKTQRTVEEISAAVIGTKHTPESGLMARMARVEAVVFHTHRRRTDPPAPLEGES